MDLGRRSLSLASLAALLFVVPLVVGAITATPLAVAGDGDREVLVGSQSAGGGWDAGGTVHYLENDTIVWQEESADNYFDVTPLSNGTVLAAFSTDGYESGCEPYEAPCTKTGYRIVDSDAEGGPAVVEEYAFPVRTSTNSEVHDVERLESEEFLLVDMDRERVFTVADGEVTWQWNASERYTSPEDPTRSDWLHMNDVDAINETHYLVSVRNANQLLVLERGAGVVDVINEDRGGSDDSCEGLVAGGDGDRRCGDPEVINHQHNPQWLDEGAVLVADSENDRVVELHHNETVDRWEPVWAVDQAGGAALDWPRDADRLSDGNTLITDSLNGRVVEIAPNGTVTWSADSFHIPYEADRLPDGELVGGDRYTSEGAVADPGNRLPLLSTLVTAIRGQFSVIPHWFGPFHLVTTALAAVLAIAAGIDGWRARRRDASDSGL